MQILQCFCVFIFEPSRLLSLLPPKNICHTFVLMAKHNELGAKGEELAKQLLIDKGYQILHTNWRYRHEEIDIIARTGSTVVFVEVKTRATAWHQSPVEAVDDAKIRHLVSAADHFMTRLGDDCEFRFDIISVVVSPSGNVIEHYEDAFLPPLL